VAVFLYVEKGYGQIDSVAMRYAALINPEELKKHLSVLSSDEYEGRETGMSGQRKASAYIKKYYESIGLLSCETDYADKPIFISGNADNSYGCSSTQSFPLKRTKYTKSFMMNDNASFKFIDDFLFFGIAGNDTLISSDQILFAGYGIDDPLYSDYQKLDVKGKLVMCYDGEPVDKKGNSIFTGNTSLSKWGEDMDNKIEVARSRGAKAILLIQPDYQEFVPRIRYWLEQPRMTLDKPSEESNGFQMIMISEQTANKLLGMKGKKNIGDIKKQIDRKKRTKSYVVSAPVSIHLVSEVDHLESNNVLAFIEGTDPQLKNEVVVISAHYDHVGIMQGQVYNGADDDGSGTVSTLEIAKAFRAAKANKQMTKRSILILNVSGEEKGLLGSDWYTTYPLIPLHQTVCDLNIDMIGRVDDAHLEDDRYVYLIGSDKLSTELHQVSEDCNRKYTHLKLDYTYNDPNDPNRFYYRSDHYNFAKNNVPVIFYFSGVHSDYHQPGDDYEKIHYEKMSEIAKLVFYTAWNVANLDQKLKVDVTNDFK
jgi:hypothetical protein